MAVKARLYTLSLPPFLLTIYLKNHLNQEHLFNTVRLNKDRRHRINFILHYLSSWLTI